MGKVGTIGTAVGGMFFGLLVMLGSVFGSAEDAAAACDTSQVAGAAIAASMVAGTGNRLPEQVGNYTGVQVVNAAKIISAGKELGVPLRAQAIAVMTAMGESSIRVLDYGDTAGPDSRGLFQQRDNGAWGTLEDRMDPRRSSISFYKALLQVPGWETLQPTIAAHKTQRNADPHYYSQFWDDALLMLARLSGVDFEVAMMGAGASTSCDAAALVAGGSVAYPVPKSLIATNNDNWGRSGGLWSARHTGTDFSVPCGTPIFASHGGKVIVDTTQAWAGPQLVKVSTGEGKLTTWYAHMQRVTVPAGAQVSAGQQIGEAGAEGNATGCHLHFEVHPEGGTIYEDNVDPTAWLAQNAGKNLPGTPATGGAGGLFTVASFNALGHSHTAPGGDRAGWADSGARTRGLARVLRSYKTELVGLQEFQPPQQRVLYGALGATYGHYGNVDNVIIWRKSSFDFLAGDTLAIPYFKGNTRLMPVTVLRHRATGSIVIVISVHNPADAHGPAQKWRNESIRTERAAVQAFRARTGAAVLTVGDFNDREEAFCPLTAEGLMTSPAGGSNSTTGCRVPLRHPVDWIFGAGISWHSYKVDKTVQGVMSDHPYVTASGVIR